MNEQTLKLVKDILIMKINLKQEAELPYLTESDINVIHIVCENIYTLGVAEGMNRALEAMRKDFKLPEEGM